MGGECRRGGLSHGLDARRDRGDGGRRKLLRELAFPRKKPDPERSGLFVYPAVKECLTAGLKVAGTGFEPATSRL